MIFDIQATTHRTLSVKNVQTGHLTIMRRGMLSAANGQSKYTFTLTCELRDDLYLKKTWKRAFVHLLNLVMCFKNIFPSSCEYAKK